MEAGQEGSNRTLLLISFRAPCEPGAGNAGSSDLRNAELFIPKLWKQRWVLDRAGLLQQDLLHSAQSTLTASWLRLANWQGSGGGALRPTGAAKQDRTSNGPPGPLRTVTVAPLRTSPRTRHGSDPPLRLGKHLCARLKKVLLHRGPCRFCQVLQADPEPASLNTVRPLTAEPNIRTHLNLI